MTSLVPLQTTPSCATQESPSHRRCVSVTSSIGTSPLSVSTNDPSATQSGTKPFSLAQRSKTASIPRTLMESFGWTLSWKYGVLGSFGREWFLRNVLRALLTSSALKGSLNRSRL